MKKIILILIFFFSLSLNNVFSDYSNTKIKKIYDKAILKIEKKYSKQKTYLILKNLDRKIFLLLSKEKKDSSKYKVLKYLYQLNQEKLKFFQKKYDNYKSLMEQKEAELNKILKKQKNIESSIKNNLLLLEKNIIIPDYITSLSKNKKIFIVNKKMEFFSKFKIKKIIFSKYYNITLSNYNFFKNKTGIIIHKEGENFFWFVENYSFEEKIAYSESKNYFKGFYFEEIPFFKENGIYYSYIFRKFNYINDSYGIYKSDLEKSGINTKNLIIFLNKNGKFNFVSDYKKIKLIDSSLISGVKNKWYFLKELVDDKKFLNNKTDKDFLELKQITLKLTNGLSDEQKILKIYDRILENISYTKNINLKDYKIYSGIETFKNKSGVCEGYVKLMAYMLMFAGFTDLEVIRGYVIDAIDFPQIGHAWLRLNDKYYDPTFDDPIGAIRTKKFSNYYYYGLPKELFYTNRYLKNNLPKNLISKSLYEREKIVRSNIYNYAKNHPDQNYNILKSAKLRLKYGFGNRELQIEDFKKILNFQVLDNSYKIKINGKIKKIKTYKYIPVTDTNIENIIAYNFNYNIDNLFLLYRKINGKNDYILAYDFDLID